MTGSHADVGDIGSDVVPIVRDGAGSRIPVACRDDVAPAAGGKIGDGSGIGAENPVAESDRVRGTRQIHDGAGRRITASSP
ncbi:MAG: hypothetical protein ACKPB4_10515, partial [Sphaerospermopsis kisseleviana]